MPVNQVNLIGSPNRYVEQDLAEAVNLRNNLAAEGLLGREFCVDRFPRVELTLLGLVCNSDVEWQAMNTFKPSLEILQQANKLQCLAVFFERFPFDNAKIFDDVPIIAKAFCQGIYNHFEREVALVGYYRDANRNRSNWIMIPKNDLLWNYKKD